MRDITPIDQDGMRNMTVRGVARCPDCGMPGLSVHQLDCPSLGRAADMERAPYAYTVARAETRVERLRAAQNAAWRVMGGDAPAARARRRPPASASLGASGWLFLAMLFVLALVGWAQSMRINALERANSDLASHSELHQDSVQPSNGAPAQ